MDYQTLERLRASGFDTIAILRLLTGVDPRELGMALQFATPAQKALIYTQMPAAMVDPLGRMEQVHGIAREEGWLPSRERVNQFLQALPAFLRPGSLAPQGWVNQ